MDDKPEAPANIKESDIVFDCPYCGKSLAIDYRGAGLTIQCTDCGNSVEVPIPDGMDIADLDSSAEEQETRILQLRRALSVAERRIKNLEAEVEELTARREALEKHVASGSYRFSVILREAAVMQGALNELSDRVKKLAESARQTP